MSPTPRANTRPRLRAFAAAITLCLTPILAASGCRFNGHTAPPDNLGDPLPDYLDIAAVYNRRVHRLATLNTRGIIVFQYADEEGDLTKDQGDLNLRIERPHRLALVIKKLGETYIWLGADRDRYWLFNLLADPSTLVLGRHERINERKARALTLPVPPRELLHLLALEPLPDPQTDAPDGTLPTISRDQRTGETVIRFRATKTEHHRRTHHREHLDTWRIALDPATNLPTRITLLDHQGNPTLDADLQNPKSVRTTGPVNPDLGPDPITPADITITRPDSDEYIRIIMEGLTDRPSNPTVFNLEERLETLRPERIIDIDQRSAPTPNPAQSGTNR